MSAEEKNKLAVTMLVTGMYLSESNMGSLLDVPRAVGSMSVTAHELMFLMPWSEVEG